jgi:hypothetical protein
MNNAAVLKQCSILLKFSAFDCGKVQHIKTDISNYQGFSKEENTIEWII